MKKLRLPKRRDWLGLVVGAVIALGIVGIVHLIQTKQTAVAYQSKGITAPWVPSTVTRWSSTIDAMGKKYNVDPNLIAIIMIMESGGDSKANSGEAQGLMQITPLTAQDIASKYLKKPVKTYNLYDPTTSIEFGTAYLAYLRDVFQSSNQKPSWNATVELIAAGYNGGPGTAGSLYAGKGMTDTQTVVYSRDAFNMWRERHANDSPTFDRWKERGGVDLINDAKAEKL